ncbi:hypothetical protein [Actinacidiphila acidipaludis]|uniref:Uncharacterized protein n=1 Tax=Actinacidiphila acidipaludis TaxID=2873382 RepID=A0ABS7PZY6_9ACTN|nr:hypothetical protein [Streptomyces acidipaludis]MBY8876446.1 hypothetical protein [Streptomyces acidipaludis]
MLHEMLLVAVVIAVGLYAAMGVMALTTGRAVLWRREDILRPRLWGWGALLFASGLGLSRFAGSLHDRTVSDVAFACSMLLLICGVVLQHFGQRVGQRAGR